MTVASPLPPVEHQPRDHAVRCVRHNNPTYAWDAKCERCVIEDNS